MAAVADAHEADRARTGGRVVRRGRLVRFEHRRNDRLAIGLLSGRSASVADNRERATSRRKHRAKLRARAELEAAEKAAAEAIAAAHQEVLDRIEAERLDPTLRKPRFAKRLPRIGAPLRSRFCSTTA
jgi:hypothetical protein